MLRIVMDCDFEYVEYLLQQADEVGIVTDYHNFLITSLDVERLDLSPYNKPHNSNVNITGYRIVDPSSPAVQDYTKKWSFGSNKGREHALYSENAVLYDAGIFNKNIFGFKALEIFTF